MSVANVNRFEGSSPLEPWEFDYTRLLYRGGAAAPFKMKTSELEKCFGEIDIARLPLLLKIDEVIQARVIAGHSKLSAKASIDLIRKFYLWNDNQRLSLTLDNVAIAYLSWSDYLLSRARNGEIKELTAYGMACIVSSILDEVLELEDGLIRQTRHRRRGRAGRGFDHGVNIQEAILFGHTLCDICDSLTTAAIRGSLPVKIKFRSGQEIKHWSGLRAVETLKSTPANSSVLVGADGNMSKRHAWELDPSNRTRRALINLRIQSEMLIFVAQTGMNSSQVRTLKVGGFSYQSHIDGYLVRRVYKPRRQGEVEFQIYKEYRVFFERYLKWLQEIFPEGERELLFPFIAAPTSRQRSLNGVCENLKGVRNISMTLNVVFLTPRELRKTRVNWLARNFGDLTQTAEMAQTSKEVLLRNYLVPDPQIATNEIVRFFKNQNSNACTPPGPGICIEPRPALLPDCHEDAPQPDCVSPSGCMFCAHQRDIDSLDHIWSLLSYKHLKLQELMTHRPPVFGGYTPPAEYVLDRVSEKIKAFELSSEKRRLWVETSRDKVREGDYHPAWSGFIELIEMQT